MDYDIPPSSISKLTGQTYAEVVHDVMRRQALNEDQAQAIIDKSLFTRVGRMVTMTRHLNVRKHSTWTAEVSDEMLADPAYFDAEGYPTAQFDQWMCDNGDESAVIYDAVDDDQLYYEVQ